MEWISNYILIKIGMQLLIHELNSAVVELIVVCWTQYRFIDRFPFRMRYFQSNVFIGANVYVLADCPVCTFSAYSCGWTDLNNSDMYLKPVELFNDPFRRGQSKLALCEVYETMDSPAGKYLGPFLVKI